VVAPPFPFAAVEGLEPIGDEVAPQVLAKAPDATVDVGVGNL
jgi:hypothetical protein